MNDLFGADLRATIQRMIKEEMARPTGIEEGLYGSVYVDRTGRVKYGDASPAIVALNCAVSGGGTIQHNTSTVVNWSTQRFDTSTMWPINGNQRCIGVSHLSLEDRQGAYLITANLRWDTSTVGSRRATILWGFDTGSNTGSELGRIEIGASPSGITAHTIVLPMYESNFAVEVWQDSGGPLSLSGVFSVMKIGARS